MKPVIVICLDNEYNNPAIFNFLFNTLTRCVERLCSLSNDKEAEYLKSKAQNKDVLDSRYLQLPEGGWVAGSVAE